MKDFNGFPPTSFEGFVMLACKIDVKKTLNSGKNFPQCVSSTICFETKKNSLTTKVKSFDNQTES